MVTEIPLNEPHGCGQIDIPVVLEPATRDCTYYCHLSGHSTHNVSVFT